MLPTDIHNLILEFHDEYETVEKKRRINLVIESGYRNWLYCQGAYDDDMVLPLQNFYCWQINSYFYCSYRNVDIQPDADQMALYFQCFRFIDKNINTELSLFDYII